MHLAKGSKLIMATTIDTSNAHSILPEEILDWAARYSDPRDDESMIAAASKLYSLHNNRDFVANDLAKELSNIANGRFNSQLSPQSLVHGHRSSLGNHFTVRTVSWLPPLARSERSNAIQSRTFSYAAAHDHNFALLTIGYVGPGYETVIHEYDNSMITGYAGEPVAIRYLETTSLSVGKVMYYRPSRDIHSQRHPPEPSLSLNLIGERSDVNSIPQFEFDTVSGRIARVLPENTVSRQLLPFKIASLVGVSDETADLMLYIAKRHQAPQTRLAAWTALLRLRPSHMDSFIDKIKVDPHPLIQRGLVEFETLQSSDRE